MNNEMNVAHSFTVLFHGCRNIELVKDVGRIPYYLYKQFGYDAKIVCYKNEEEYGYLKDEAAGLKIEHIKKVKGIPFHIAPILYLLKNADTIAILNLYHLSLETTILGILYRILNKNGKLYVKTDLSVESFERYSAFADQSKNLLKRIPDYIFRWMLQNSVIRVLIRYCSLVSVESEIGKALLLRRFHSIKDKCIVIPNGAGIQVDTTDVDKLFKNKKDIILVVGRIGVPQKNHEMLLNALGKVHLRQWKVVLLGSIEEPFWKNIAEITAINPDLKEKLILPGHITDRNVLLKHYAEARVFCLTSNYEGFCIAMVEAICTGNYLVTTRIPSGIDISGNGKYGTIVDRKDSDALAEKLQDIIDEKIDIEKPSREAVKYAGQMYYWPSIVAKLKENIDNLYEEEME